MYGALDDFIKICGTPQEVMGNCNNLVNRVLEKHGKRSKGGHVFSRYLFRTVKDIKK